MQAFGNGVVIALIVDGVHGQEQIERTVGILSAQGIVTVAGRFVFYALVIRVTHAVLSVYRKAGKARSFVGNHVVPKTGSTENRVSLSGVATPGGTEGGHHAMLSPRGGATVDRAHTAESDLTEASLQEERCFTTEEVIVVFQGTVIAVELVFQNETNRQSVAEVFRALKAEAGTGLHTGFHRELVNRINALTGSVDIHVAAQITNTGIDNTVELNVSSQSGAGESTKNCNSSQSLFHDFYLLVLFQDLQGKNWFLQKPPDRNMSYGLLQRHSSIRRKSLRTETIMAPKTFDYQEMNEKK